ncbi:MAG TPA: hypothetical protein PKE00_10925, partial [Planctomycetota bacterium]|nr:hypothetical protein [Planctomycetota bacterium]
MEESILGAPTGVGVAIEPGRKTDPSQRTSRRAPRLDRPDLLAKREAAQSVQAPERKRPTKAPSRTAGLSGGETRSQAVQPARRPEVARREPVVVLRPEPMAPPGHRICPS